MSERKQMSSVFVTLTKHTAEVGFVGSGASKLELSLIQLLMLELLMHLKHG